MKVQNNLTYIEIDGLKYPDFKEGNQPKREIGIWGHRHANYLREFHPTIYYSMLCKMTLADYLETIDNQAKARYDILIKDLAKQQGINEQLKADNQMLWVQRMNHIANQARDIVYDEIIFIYNKIE